MAINATGVNFNPAIVRNGLVCYVDAFNPRSLPSDSSSTVWRDLSGEGVNWVLTPGYESSRNDGLIFNGNVNITTDSTQYDLDAEEYAACDQLNLLTSDYTVTVCSRYTVARNPTVSGGKLGLRSTTLSAETARNGVVDWGLGMTASNRHHRFVAGPSLSVTQYPPINPTRDYIGSADHATWWQYMTGVADQTNNIFRSYWKKTQYGEKNAPDNEYLGQRGPTVFRFGGGSTADSSLISEDSAGLAGDSTSPSPSQCAVAFVMIYNRALTSSEIVQNYHAQRRRLPSRTNEFDFS